MSQSEFFDWLLKIGMSYPCWTEQQTLDTSMPAIVMAYEGCVERLRLCYGGAEPEPSAPAPSAPTVNKIQSVIRALAG